MKIAAFGPNELIEPFKAIGIETFSSGENNEEILKSIISKGYNLILITEDVLATFNYLDYIYLPQVTLLPIPGIYREKEGIGKKILRDVIRKAVGIEVGGIND